jgi:uncharacterized membrane protein HdeD (DUF308 family)
MANPFVRNWWIAAGRSGLAVLFGLVVLCWRGLEFNVLVALFGTYVCVDAVYSLAALFLRSTTSPVHWWPVVLEAVVGLAVGVAALAWPLVPDRVIEIIAVWAVIIGILEILLATRVPRQMASHWFLAFGGLASLFLGVLMWTLPHAVASDVARRLGIYGLVFGVLVFIGALRLRQTGEAMERVAR